LNYKIYKSPDKALIQRRKINVIFLLLFAVFVLILTNLVRVQLIETERYKTAARKQYENKFVLTPFRGLIFDRNMNVLVSNSYELVICSRS
jgi:cell division protein FtsI/penicillin-binding protein 2